MPFGGGVSGAFSLPNHKHTNVLQDGGELEELVTLVDGATLSAWVAAKIAAALAAAIAAEIIVTPINSGTNASSGAARFNGLISFHAVTPTETSADDPLPSNKTGIMTNFKVIIATNTSDFAVVHITRINGVDGNQTFSVPGGNTGTFEDTTNKDNVFTEDLVCFKTSGAGGTGAITDCTSAGVTLKP